VTKLALCAQIALWCDGHSVAPKSTITCNLQMLTEIEHASMHHSAHAVIRLAISCTVSCTQNIEPHVNNVYTVTGSLSDH
jgi:hypothetical protein